MKREKPDAAAATIFKALPKNGDLLNTGGPEYRPPPWVRKFRENPREIRIQGKEGADLLNEWRGQTESEMKAILQRDEWGLLRVLGILRRLPMDYFFLGEHSAEGALRSFDPRLANVAEWTSLKYTAWAARGTRLEPLAKGPSGFSRDVPELDHRSLEQIMALTRHTGPEFGHLEEVRKTLARGGETVTLRPDGVMDARPPPELERRFKLYDRRKARFSFPGSTAGIFRPSSASDDPLGFVYYFEMETWREDEGGQPYRHEYVGRWIPKREKRFKIQRMPLRSLYEYLHLLEDVVVERYRLTPEVIVAALMSLERLLTHFLAAGLDLTHVQGDRWVSVERTGYLLVEKGAFDGVVLGTLPQQAHEHAFPGVPYEADPEYFTRAFKRLAYLDSYSAEDISLEDGQPWVRGSGDSLPTPMPRPFVYPAGPSARLVDLYALGDFVRGLYECLVPPPEQGKRVSKDFELRLDEYLGENLDRPRAFPSGKELWRQIPGGRKERVAELDVSFRVDAVLVVIDAKSIPLSPGYRRYQYGALRTRWEKFAGDGKKEGYVKKADKQAENLARYPRGTNYDLLAAGYTHVVTLLCSTHPEYIDTDDPTFYVRDELPRVATPQELRGFLAETDELELKSLPFARRLADDGALSR